MTVIKLGYNAMTVQYHNNYELTITRSDTVAQPGFGGVGHSGSGERKSPSGVQGQSPWWVVRGGHSLPKAHSSY